MLGSVVRELRLAPERTVAYVCGDPEITLAVDGILRTAGLEAHAIHKELYWPLRA